jgi:hypothetical protein
MDWNWLADGSGLIAVGAENVYLVTQDRNDVRLTRYRSRHLVEVAQEAARNVIEFQLAPARPDGHFEVAGLLDAAVRLAGKYESGEALPGHAAWQQPRTLPAAAT